jgi:CRISPR/Cas system CSM-associated protein Csm2 small subunit
MSSGYRGPGPGQGNRPRDQQNDTVNYAPAYYDAKGCLRREIFTSEARCIAGSLNTSRTNLRRGYDEVVSIKVRISESPDKTQCLIEEGMGRLQRWARYQSIRPAQPISREAEAFIRENCAKVKTRDDFRGFYELFQSVMAYLDRS